MIIKRVIKLSLKDVPEFTKGLIKKLAPLKIDENTIFDIRLCIEETLTNAAKHGNKMNSDKNIFLKINATEKLIIIDIKDEGSGFDYKSIPLPTKKVNIEKLSGRGIFLIRNIMDSIEFLDNGSRIKMIKRLKPKGAKHENN